MRFRCDFGVVRLIGVHEGDLPGIDAPPPQVVFPNLRERAQACGEPRGIGAPIHPADVAPVVNGQDVKGSRREGGARPAGHPAVDVPEEVRRRRKRVPAEIRAAEGVAGRQVFSVSPEMLTW